jgi:arginine deiminase
LDCETRICEAQKRNFLRRFAAAALVFTLILGNCYHTYETNPLFLKNQDNKKELLVDPLPPFYFQRRNTLSVLPTGVLGFPQDLRS